MRKKDDGILKMEGGILGHLTLPGATSVECSSGQCKAHIPVYFVTLVVKIFGNALWWNLMEI